MKVNELMKTIIAYFVKYVLLTIEHLILVVWTGMCSLQFLSEDIQVC